MKVAILNDTHGPHVGCQLVTQAFREQLDRVGVELLGVVHKTVRKIDLYPAFVKEADLVIVNGEGSIHHGQRLELLEVAARFPAILVNCVFEDNPPTPALKLFRFVSARESLSAAQLAAQGVQAEVIPDLILTASALCAFHRQPPEADLGLTDNVLDRQAGFSALVGEGNVGAYLYELCRYRRLCVGRFHAALMAAALGIPFAAWASNTHKTKGLMMDMGVDHLYAETQAEAMARVPTALPDSVAAYVEDGRRKVNALFDRLHTYA
jgi:Polysaccharide pyruvyl transferase